MVPMGVGGHSYYYSLTNLQAAGGLTLKGIRYGVSGLAWMDHQWGRWDWKTVHGWDWMALQLDNGMSLALYGFVGGHSHNGKQASISFPDGRELAVHNATMAPFQPSWTSPASKNTYPLAWHVRVPVIGLDATVQATVPGQEMVDSLFSGGAYWEGSGRLSGALHGKPIGGLVYTELAGYGKQSALGF